MGAAGGGAAPANCASGRTWSGAALAAADRRAQHAARRHSGESPAGLHVGRAYVIMVELCSRLRRDQAAAVAAGACAAVVQLVAQRKCSHAALAHGQACSLGWRGADGTTAVAGHWQRAEGGGRRVLCHLPGADSHHVCHTAARPCADNCGKGLLQWSTSVLGKLPITRRL